MTSADEAYRLLTIGQRNLRIACTRLNHTSSRRYVGLPVGKPSCIASECCSQRGQLYYDILLLCFLLYAGGAGLDGSLSTPHPSVCYGCGLPTLSAPVLLSTTCLPGDLYSPLAVYNLFLCTPLVSFVCFFPCIYIHTHTHYIYRRCVCETNTDFTCVCIHTLTLQM